MAMSRQQDVCDESPKEGNNADDHPPRTEMKRKKFRPFRAVRNIFRRRMRRQGSDNLQDYKKSRSTTELQNDQEGGRRFSSPNSSYSVGLSVSHDSIFSPDHAATSLDPQELRNIHGFLSVQHVELKDIKSELFARIRARRDSDDEDAGLPHSPCTSPTTADVLSQNLKTKGGISHTTCSAGSLISMGSSENDEELSGQTLSSHSSRMSLSDRKYNDSDDTDVTQPVPLSHKAAHHKIAVRPKRTHGLPRHRKQQLAASGLGSLPSTPEISEDSGRPSSCSLQSSKNYLSELESSSEGINVQPVLTSPNLKEEKSFEDIADLIMNSPLDNSNNNRLIDSLNQESAKSSPSSSGNSPKWNVIESFESSYDKSEKDDVFIDLRNAERSPGCHSSENEESVKSNSDCNSPRDKTDKETKGVFAMWGARVRKNSDVDKSEKSPKEERESNSNEEPFLSRWFGSRRSNRKNRKSSEEECSSPNKEETKILPEHTGYDSSKTPANAEDKRKLFLNLNSNTCNESQVTIKSVVHRFGGNHYECEKISPEQNTFGKHKPEYEFKQTSTAKKQVVKSSSDDCVNYSLHSDKQDGFHNCQNTKGTKSPEICQAKDNESGVIKSTSTSILTTWADVKRAQRNKQENIAQSPQNNSNVHDMHEMKKAFNIENFSKEQHYFGNDVKQNVSKGSFSENNVTQWKQNVKTLYNSKDSTINGFNVEEPYKRPEILDQVNGFHANLKVNSATEEQHEIIKTKIENIDSQNKTKCSDPIPANENQQELISHETFPVKDQSNTEASFINVSKSNVNNKYNLKTKLKSNNSISKADINQKDNKNAKPKSEGNSEKDLSEKSKTKTKDVGNNVNSKTVQIDQKNNGKVSPNMEDDNTSLPQTSELFRVFARRSIKQKHSDQEKSDLVNGTSRKNIKKDLSGDNKLNKASTDKETSKNISNVTQMKEKVTLIQDNNSSNGLECSQSRETKTEVKVRKNSDSDISNVIMHCTHSNTENDLSQLTNSTSEMRTRISSVPESSKKNLLKNKHEFNEESKTECTLNERDKSKSFKLRNSPTDTKNAEETQQPAWLRLAQQRREQREQKEKQLYGSSSPPNSEANGKSYRSTKVLDMVSNFQKLQMT